MKPYKENDAELIWKRVGFEEKALDVNGMYLKDFWEQWNGLSQEAAL